MGLYDNYDKLKEKYGEHKNYNGYLHALLDDYLSGGEIDNVDELENNPDFMMNAIYSTKNSDKYDRTAIIKLCGNDVIKSFAFVSVCLNLFYDRPEALINLCKKYLVLNTTGDVDVDYLNEEITEILARIVFILKSNYRYREEYMDDLMEFGKKLSARYDYNINLYEYTNRNADNFGFKYVCLKYNNNPYIMNFIVQKTLDRILKDEDVTHSLSNLVRRCSSDEDFEIAINKAVKIVLSKDPDYSIYVKKNAYLYSKMKKCIKEELSRLMFETTEFGGVKPTSMELVKKP